MVIRHTAVERQLRRQRTRAGLTVDLIQHAPLHLVTGFLVGDKFRDDPRAAKIPHQRKNISIDDFFSFCLHLSIHAFSLFVLVHQCAISLYWFRSYHSCRERCLVMDRHGRQETQRVGDDIENSAEPVLGEVRNRTVDAFKRAGRRRYADALRGHLNPRTREWIVPEELIRSACCGGVRVLLSHLSSPSTNRAGALT